MATLTELYSGSASISTTEYSLTNNSTTLGAQTGDGYIQIWLDLNAMIAGDQYELRIYEKVRSSSSQRLVARYYFTGAQGEPVWVSPPLSVMHGWEVSMDRLAGADRTIEWSIRTP